MRKVVIMLCYVVTILAIAHILQNFQGIKNTTAPSSHKSNSIGFNYVINEEHLCEDKHGVGVVLLVVVFLGANDIYEREFIRNTWGAIAKSHPKIRLFFILGSTFESSNTTQALQSESLQFHDIIQCDFEDQYKKLVNKSFAAFRWTVHYCDRVKYVLKIDSDMRIDLSSLLTVLEKPDIPDKLLCGDTVYRAPLVNRNKKHRFYVSKEEYPQLRYPDFCQGAAYIIPRRIVGRFASSRIPENLFPLDDNYFTGILRKELNEELHKGFLSYRHHHDKTETRLKNGRYIMNVTSRGHEIKKLRKIALKKTIVQGKQM
ncbi:hypothetical protein FSP39_014036 [Pinctada imbricata]|uniref:Hexosyltransferase n=1 Tax=Pinctada imbricata TaxID=66713 RepID=A0AA89CA15_PINIB|nr:hypothetical protein FSP39_014036 [Pinctada imbricata]